MAALDGLREHRENLEDLARALLASETLDEEDAYRIAGFARPPKPENPVRIAREAADNGKRDEAPAPVPTPSTAAAEPEPWGVGRPAAGRGLAAGLDVLPLEVANAADRWSVAEGAVRPALVVVAEPVWQRGGAGVA